MASMSPVPKKARLDESIESVPASDGGSPSGFIRFEVGIVDIYIEEKYSPIVEVVGLPWKLLVRVMKMGGSYFLQAYLNHRESDCDLWSIDVSAEISLITNVAGNNVIHKFKNTFNHECPALGFSQFCPYEDLMNEQKGFIKDGKIVLEARFTLSNLVGIRVNPHIDFSDSNEVFQDVALVIEGEKIYVSKQILAIHSTYFKDLFYRAEKNKDELKLEGIDRKEFVEMLNRIYPSYSKISDDNAEYLLKISDRFQIKTILDQVERFLIASSKHNVFFKLNLSDQYKLIKLQEHCLNTFKNVKDITDLQSTQELSRSAKATLLEKVLKLGKSPVQQKKPVTKKSDSSRMASDDGSQSGFIRFEVGISDITTTGIYSPVIEVLGLPWNLEVKKLSNPAKFGVCLMHRTSDSDIWSIDVSVGLTLINIDEEKNLHQTFEKTFSHNVIYSDWFLSMWEDVHSDDKGFVNDGKIVIEARFVLSNIIGIRINSHIDFTEQKEPFHDVALIIEGEKIYVSKQILAVHSPVFKAMFYGEFSEKNKEEIELKEIDRKVFIVMLNLIYPSYEKITGANIEPLLKLADRFQIKMVNDLVEQFIVDSTKLNIPSKLNLSEQYRLVTLQEHCFNTFKNIKDIKKLQRAKGYKQLSKNMKATLLDKVMKLNWD